MADSQGFENISEGERNDFVSTVGEIYKAKISDIEATLKKIRVRLQKKKNALGPSRPLRR